ncbi:MULTISPECIES: M4 family metallopeptidase [unclassified Nocardioides]|uniref:M4 family metallopeptidase n=1 Tax=unclassified Nocardioides TaxID=2615069 RepID=UPI0018863DA3|nr:MULTISPECIES: M4 family metallopeptidase [unclassified Nocardioides]
MKFSMQGLSLALIAAGLAAAPGLQASAAGPAPRTAAPDDALVAKMRNAAEGKVTLTREDATGAVGFVRADDLLPSVEGGSRKGSVDKASAYLDRYAHAFGAPRAQLVQSGVVADEHGWTVDYVQRYRGVEVFGSRLRAHLDRQGDLTAVNGYVAPDLELSTSPRLNAVEAGERAIATVQADPPEGARPGGLEAAASDLVIYRLGAIKGEAGDAVLAYEVEVTNGRDVRETVIVDAASGKPVNRWSMIHSVERELYEASVNNEGTPDDDTDDTVKLDRVWREGNPRDGLNESQADLIDGTGDAYWFFYNAFGRDSYDDRGAIMRTVNNDPRISCPNANWNGVTTNYCNGVTSDDTVAHEWGHAYTEYTSGLIYQWQAGAMNESFSDIWGETVDQINERFNEVPNTRRTDAQCSDYTRGPIKMTINSPASIAGPCDAAPASFGPVFSEPVTTDVVVATDDAADGTTATDGCTAFTNAGEVAGKFAYVDRGTCSFAIKAANAEAAGATGIVVGNNDPEGAPISMSGSADIYGLMIRAADGAKIKSATETVNITVGPAGEDKTDDSYRWLSGEGDPAFGGAIRDMWNPNCYGDPGKVSDAEYHCSTDDSGGVHSNSGVPNHAFALLVDGGTFNGVTVDGIGLTKAAHVFWRTQANYLTPTSDFTDLADGLAASCTDLTARGINALSTQARDQQASDEVIDAADCASVTAVAAAVELDQEPTQCDFKPLLDPDAPELECGDGLQTEVVWSEDFEDGLAGWTQDEELTFEAGHGYEWTTVADAPGGHTSQVAFAPDPADEGSCAGDADDVSSRNGLISPVLTLPAGTSPRMTFDHYVATEASWDGGNVKVSVNGGDFELLPEKAFLFNGPNAPLATEAEDNTNPMAGEPAWTGTDGGEIRGSWGQTQVDLSTIGKAGDSLQFRFDMGRDGCNGIDGWYVDDIEVVVCSEGTVEPPVAAVRSTTTATTKPAKVTRGGTFQALVTVKAAGTTPAGSVQLLTKGKKVARGTLGANGKVRLTVKATGQRFKPGTHTLVAKYLGSDTVKASRTTFKVRVIAAR